jgi:hypothetical protein
VCGGSVRDAEGEAHDAGERLMPVHERSNFENLYAGQPRWEIGRPQNALLDVADRITGSVLDAGCGRQRIGA